MITTIITVIIEVILYLIPTIIGALFRGMQVYCYNDSVKITAGNVILLIVSVLFYIIGFCMTNGQRKKKSCVLEERWSANISCVLSIALPVFFWFYTPIGMVFGKFMKWLCKGIFEVLLAVLIIGFVVLVVAGMIGMAKNSEGGEEADNSSDFFHSEDSSDSLYDQWRREAEEREKYVRDNWNSNRGRLNSDATYYQTPEGNWNKISRDGKSYEDDDGDWHLL